MNPLGVFKGKEVKKAWVYICAPFRAPADSGIHSNIMTAKVFAWRAYDEGLIPIVPHVCSPAIFGLHGENNAVVAFDLELLKKCDLMWVCGRTITEGMKTEIAYCKKNKIKVEYHPQRNG